MAKSAPLIGLARHLGQLSFINRIGRNGALPILFKGRKNDTPFLVHLLKAHALSFHNMLPIRKGSRLFVQFQGVNSVSPCSHINESALTMNRSDEYRCRANDFLHTFDCQMKSLL